MFQSLREEETSTPRHRSLIEALFGMKGENSEESSGRIEWKWENQEKNDFVNLLNEDKDVKFHRNFSSGTAVVRGMQPMSRDQHFWELKMISPVYGTDMMVGVGTSEADISQVYDKFISLLGKDKLTWGLSYTGLFHHDGESRSYSERFGQGSVIGIHLDLWNGTLSFYKNKKHLGVASRGMKGKTLYAMASSTAACSGMRILRSCSFPSSLQYLCCAKLRELIPDEKSVLKALDLPPGLRFFLNKNLGWLLDSRFAEYLAEPGMLDKNGQWSFALKPDSGDPRLTDALDDEDSDDEIARKREESVLMIGNRPYILQCSRRTGPSTSNYSFRRLCSNREAERRMASTSGERRAECAVSDAFLRMRSSEEQRMEATRLDTVDAWELFDVMDDEEQVLENDAKRRRCSYNYAMGLSDPDSD